MDRAHQRTPSVSSLESNQQRSINTKIEDASFDLFHVYYLPLKASANARVFRSHTLVGK